MYCIYNNIQIVLSNGNGISFKILQKILQIILVFCLNLIDRLYVLYIQQYSDCVK